LASTIADNSTSYKKIRAALAAAGEDLKARFEAGESVVELVHARAAVIDEQLRNLWSHDVEASGAALIAVGGYGRGELHPYSDVDVMVLLPDDLPPGAEEALSAFITSLWDVGLEIGHSVRTIAQCFEEASSDLTVATTLMEARLLAGPKTLFEAMQAIIAPDKMWPSTEYFKEKRKEQIARHHRYHDTAYNLEPNVKGSPGGLRDIQMIGWVAKRHFGAATLAELVEHRFLTPGQLQRLEDGQAFLWRIRFGLHVLTGRREDRLLFDHQIKLAHMLGYEDASYTLAVEQLMQRYYRTVMALSRLNEMLLQLFEEAILMDPNAAPEPLDARFQIKNGFLQTVHDRVFAEDPSALLELFLVLQQTPEIRGVSAYTIGLVRRNLHHSSRSGRRHTWASAHEPLWRAGSLHSVLRSHCRTHAVRPVSFVYGRRTHIVRRERFSLPRFNHEFPHCSEIMQSLDQPEIAYLGGLFHDIAKGRGGDHSELGAVDARAFCLEHGLSKYEAGVVAWLVEHHLTLSTTAQKKDIGDPDVINEFASIVGDPLHLDYLYLLTVADIRGTSPKLWNSWKAQLFDDLYELTRRALRRGLENPIDREQLILEKQTKAREMLNASGLTDQRIDEVWQLMNTNYFLRHRAAEIAWHTEWLADSDTESDVGLVDVRRRENGDGVEAALYTPSTKRTFAHATAVLDELGMTIMDARIVPLEKGYSIDSFVFMELDDRVELDESRMNKIRRSLTRVLTAYDDNEVTVTRTVPRQARMFTTRASVEFSPSTTGDNTVFELVAADQPGLLSKIGRVFIEQGIDIEAAKIMTIGERAEDVFYICRESGGALDDSEQAELRSALLARIDSDLD
jgi:[protein-PII] uridylyltransferase